MWMAFMAAFWALTADLRRRKLPPVADNIILWCAFAGVFGAKLYHELQSPAEFFPNLGLAVSSFHGFYEWFSAGLAWFGGFLGVIAALVLLARHYHLRPLAMLDLCSPAASLGYAIGRIGCLISGDGDYGVKTSLPWGMSFPNGLVPTTDRVHPTPIYEFFGGVVIFWFLWKLGEKGLRGAQPVGEITAHYLLWSGLARFLVEFIRINPHTVFGVFSNAQAVALLSMIAGAALLLRLRTLRPVVPA
jgi:phosphatidylglycerol---prolipoprotein diacylglyceryl transferase